MNFMKHINKPNKHNNMILSLIINMSCYGCTFIPYFLLCIVILLIFSNVIYNDSYIITVKHNIYLHK